MKFTIAEDYQALSRLSAHLLAGMLRRKPSLVIGFATGGTPIGMYEELARLHRKEHLDFSQASSFNLDEYAGLPPDHGQSYHYYMHRHVFSKLNLAAERTHLPKGDVSDPEKEISRYERLLAASGGIDLQILGIGTNGHIGFNEPGSDPEGRTHLVDLAPSTVKSNARYFGDISEVPRRAITMGIGNIMESRRILLMASGEEKADAILRLAGGAVDAGFPASFLNRHPDVHVIVDRLAGRLSAANKIGSTV